MAFPNPANVSPWYLRNITQALALDETSGNVYLRTDAQIGTINIAGNVNIPGNINANVYRLGNVDISSNTLPVSGTVTSLQGNTPWIISNTNVVVSSGNVGIVGNVNVNPITGNVGILGNVNVNPISGNVNVTQGTSPWIISNTNVTITSGNTTVSQGTSPWVISNTNVTVTSGNITVSQGTSPWVISNTNVAITSGNVGILGNVNVTQGTSPWIISNTNVTVTSGNVGILGNVNVNPITGNVTITGDANVSGNVGIVGNVNVTQGNIPWIISNTNVTVTSGNVGILGNVNVNPISGNVGIVGNVNVNPITGNVSIIGNVNVNPITGSVSITGNANVAGNVGILGNVTVTQGTTPWIVSGNVNANITGGNVTATVSGTTNVAITGTNLDAFGRLRISNPFTLFDSQNMYIDGGQFSNILVGGGNVVYLPNESSFDLSVGTANNDSVIRQSLTTQPYQPGKSLLILNSFKFSTLISNLRQRVGYFTANNGIYFEADGETLYMVTRSSVSGSVQEERIPQSNWNGDTLTGLGGATNPSGIEINPELVNIFWCDIEWLGVGNVRVGFIINGQFIVCHTFEHANLPGNTTVYMTSATLNPRYEITNTGATGSPSTMKQICSTVISEGGYSPTGTVNYVGSGIQPTRLATANVFTSLATIRLNPAYPDAVVFPQQVDILLTDVQYGAFQLVLNASNVANLTYSNVNGGVVQANVSAVQIDDGTVVFAGLTSSRDTLVVDADLQRRIQLARQANGQPVTLTLCAGYGSPNADLLWRFGWSELTS